VGPTGPRDSPIPANFNGAIGVTNLGAIVRLKPNGEKDTNFSTFTTATSAQIVTLPNQQFYAFGSIEANTNHYITLSSNPPPFRAGVIRFNPDGSVDPSFSATFGATNTPVISGPGELVPYLDGRILIGGAGLSNVNSRLTPNFARLSSTGELDLPFLTNSTAAIGKNNQILDFDISPEGKILVFRYGPSGSSLLMLNNDGELQSSNRIYFPSQFTTVASVRAYPDGRFLVTGPFIQIEDQPRFRFAWINPDGTVAPLGNVVLEAFTRVGGQNSLTVTTLTAGQYKLQKSADIVSWTDVMPVTLNAGETVVQFEDSGGAAFYRVAK